ncbi:MAG: hypothetical protein HON76_19805 [Candidatus Scalindua sp.]|nr:hypothetical protein [Candidatus Scalindua sp.]MBT6052862.1 hypothetical protein [Candidatus Scalindua sp.]MBT6230583.1 hypothetical protein [Candidatus Scalindua sp.]MBT6564765.1 hypothetical protein [Candidatus Scalindua sp.]
MQSYKNTKRTIGIQYEDLGFLQLRWNPCPEVSRNYGFSKYKGVLIKWGRERNSGILDVLDSINEYVLEKLIAVQECKGGISFLWRDFIPTPWGKRRVFGSEKKDFVAWKKGHDTEMYLLTRSARERCILYPNGLEECWQYTGVNI